MVRGLGRCKGVNVLKTCSWSFQQLLRRYFAYSFGWVFKGFWASKVSWMSRGGNSSQLFET